MRSIDIDLRKSLEFRPERGELLYSGERMLLLNRGALRALYELLYRELGADKRRGFLMQLGHRWGTQDFATANRLFEWDTDQDRLFAGPVTHMWQGVVHVETTSIDFDRAAGRFQMRGIWRNSYEVDLHRELAGAGVGDGKPDRCMCLAGYASGWASAFFGQPLLAIESSCVSQGAPHCTFEIRPEAVFGAEAAPWRVALAQSGTTVSVAGGLQVANDGRAAFVANMSHALRTPAAAIIGLGESLAKTTLNPAQRRSVTMLRESADTLVAIVNDILDLSQIEAGNVELETVPLDLRELVDAAAAGVESRARDKGLTFFVTAQDGFEPKIAGDAMRIRQVLIHLFANAVKATDAGAVVVTLKAPEPAKEGGSRYVIDVNDTGAGIPPDRQASLFAAFAKRDDAAPADGSGLGLAISRRLARLMGGDVEVESAVGQGSTFRFCFVAHSAPAERPVPQPGRAPEAPSNASLRVLIVEDNPVLLFLLREQLSNLGHQPVATTGGAQALAELGKQAFDVVFTDLHMPVMDGFEFNRELRSRALPKQPYVVALTADATPRQRARCLAEGIDDFAIKPLSQDGLVDLMERVREAVGATAPVENAIDEQALTALRANLGSNELLLDLIGTFIRDANELVGLFASSNDVEARRAAHSLKSTAMAVGARSLANIAAEAEKGQPAAAIPRAKSELGRVEAALRAWGA